MFDVTTYSNNPIIFISGFVRHLVLNIHKSMDWFLSGLILVRPSCSLFINFYAGC